MVSVRGSHLFGGTSQSDKKITGFMATSNGHHKATACQNFPMRFHMELALPEISHFCITVVLLQAFRPSEELRSWQARMASLLRQQREKGGVIDPSREDDTIDETWVRPEGVPEDLVPSKNSMVQKLASLGVERLSEVHCTRRMLLADQAIPRP